MLDVLTPRGEITRDEEKRAICLIETRYPSLHFIPTPKDPLNKPERVAAILDAIVLLNGTLYATAEVKCRNMSLDTLERTHSGEWLMSWDKIAGGVEGHRLFRVGMVGILYLVPDDAVLMLRLLDDDGFVVPPVRLAATVTQRTVNGGKAKRNNAYIGTTGAQMIFGSEQTRTP